MKIDEVNFQQVGNSASTEPVGSCHDEKIERVRNSASTQLVGFCHDNKSEQVTCSEQVQDAKHPSKINETSNLRQCKSFVQISVRVWPPKILYRNEAQMVVELSGLSLIGHIIGHSVLTKLNGFVVQHELIELINNLVHVGHINLFKLSRLIVRSSSEGAQISKLIVD
jgi:hypothetical protein